MNYKLGFILLFFTFILFSQFSLFYFNFTFLYFELRQKV